MGLILGYGILTHGVIVLNDGLFWDGWLVDAWQQNNDKTSMRRFYSEVGMPHLYYEHWILGRLSWRQTAYRMISVFSLLMIALFAFLTAVYTNILNPCQAAIFSLLLLSYPAYAVTFDGVVSLQYTLKIAIFYAGCFLAVTTIAGSDAAQIAIFAISLTLFLVAFNANSVLVYFWGFLLFYAWLVDTRSPEGFGTYEIAKIALLTGLPIAYWIMKETLAPRHGYYKDYNRFKFSPYPLLQIGLRSFRYGIDVPMIKPVVEVVQSKNTLFVLASILLGALLHEYFKEMATVPTIVAVGFLVFGYALLILGTVPFMLVGQGSWEGGWGSKNFMLFHLPYALVVFGWLQLVPNSLGIVLIPLILLANTLYIIRVHLLYIAVSVRDKALIRWLSANPQLRSASVIKIREFHWAEYTFERQMDMYRPAYLSCMVKRIWPESRILAILDSWGSSEGRSLTASEIEQALEETTIRYSFAPQVQPGPQYLVTIDATTEMRETAGFREALHKQRGVDPLKQPSMVRIAFQYLYRKRFSPQRLDLLFDQYFSFSASEF